MWRRPIISILVSITCIASAVAQDTAGKKDSNRIEIQHAEYLDIIQYHNTQVNSLVHNVVLVQKDLTLYCDSAILDKASNIAKVYGKVHFNKADSVQAYADSAIYNGNARYAELYQNVRLTDNQMVITTDHLSYDMETRIATYHEGGTVTDGETKLTSINGYYYTDTDDAYFKDSVVLKHPKYSLEADTLRYNTAIDRAYFIGPTTIYNTESTVYCERGYYDTQTGLAVFHQNTHLINTPQELFADSLFYNRETGIGEAYGHIVFTDTAQHVIQYSNVAQYDEIRNVIVSTGGSVAGYVLDTDTLFIGGDTIRTMQDSLKNRQMFVFHHVKIFKSDLQGTCDSLVYSDLDSTIRLYGLPVMWSDSTQFSADTIHMLIQNKALSEIRMFSKGFIINADDSLIYNQIKGRTIFGYFQEDELRMIKAIGNGESIYFGKDDANRYIGVNKMVCSEIYIYLENKKFHRISFINAPKAEFNPMDHIQLQDLQLDNFEWLYENRPRSKEELFPEQPVPQSE